jgi:hypothetical protein
MDVQGRSGLNYEALSLSAGYSRVIPPCASISRVPNCYRW